MMQLQNEEDGPSTRQARKPQVLAARARAWPPRWINATIKFIFITYWHKTRQVCSQCKVHIHTNALLPTYAQRNLTEEQPCHNSRQDYHVFLTHVLRYILSANCVEYIDPCIDVYIISIVLHLEHCKCLGQLSILVTVLWCLVFGYSFKTVTNVHIQKLRQVNRSRSVACWHQLVAIRKPNTRSTSWVCHQLWQRHMLQLYETPDMSAGLLRWWCHKASRCEEHAAAAAPDWQTGVHMWAGGRS